MGGAAKVKTCGCTIKTSLFALCPECADKAWAYGEAMIKAEKEGRLNVGSTFEYHGPDIERGGTIYRESRLK